MKKIGLSISAVAFLFATIFTSCDKDVESTAVKIDLDKTGTLKVYIYAELDKSHAGYELVPGAQVMLKINYSDFRNGVDGAWEQVVTTNDSGSFTVNVPADDDGVTVRVTPEPFEYDQVQGYEAASQNTVTKWYAAPTTNISLSAGESALKLLSYNLPGNIESTVNLVSISGQVVAELNDTTTGSEDVEKQVSFTLHNSDWYEIVTTNSAGEFNVEVPANQTIYVSGIFTADRYRDVVGSPEEYEYELDASSIGSFSSNQDEVTIDFGSGILVE